jgi:hypothetical protein
MRLSSQIEGLISNFERVIDGFLADLPYEALVPAIQKTNTTIDVPIVDLGFNASVTAGVTAGVDIQAHEATR